MFSLGLRLVIFRSGVLDHCASGSKTPTGESMAAQTGVSVQISWRLNIQQAWGGCMILHLRQHPSNSDATEPHSE